MTSRTSDAERTRTADEDVPASDGVDPTAHLADLEDGGGCTEIWLHRSESRE
jgi:hypothetical protein